MKFVKLLIIFMLPLYLFGWKMESSSVTLPATTAGSNTWQTINFQQTYDTVPLVFALVDQGSGYNADTPVIVRIKNVSTTSFEMVQVEAQSVVESVANQGPHPSVNVHYLVIEAGDHTLSDGTRILAGVHSTTTKQGKNTTGGSGWDTVNFPSSFDATPSVLAMVQGVANETATLPGVTSVPWLTSGVRNVTANSVDLTLERAETSTGTINSNEDIAYLAMDAGKQSTLFDTDSCLSVQYETQTTGDSIRGWDNSCLNVNFANTYASNPLVIGSMNRRDGGDGGWLRRCNLTATAVGLTVDEDQAADSERSHTTENAGLVIFENNFVYDSAKTLSCNVPSVDYRMDECYWLDNAGGVIGDVKDSASNQYDATSSGTSNIDANISQLCSAGSFGINGDRVSTDDSTVLGNLSNQLTISAWLYPTAFTQWSAAVQKSSTESWSDGFGLIHNSNDGTNITFYVNNYSGPGTVSASLNMNTWNHIVGVYDGSKLSIYKNGTFIGSTAYSTSITNSTQPLTVGNDVSDAQYDDVWQGKIDELKLWDKALSATEVSIIYNNEITGKNFDGSTRVCPTCEGNLTAATWGLIGIPADLRTAAVKDVATVFDEFNASSYNVPTNADGWVVYKRDFNNTTNASNYTLMPYSGVPLEIGKGYWIISNVDKLWSENGLPNVDYNSTNSACVTNACIEIDLVSANKNFGAPDFDPNDGTGAYRNNMLGFVGHVPVNWADCRIVVTDAGGTTSYTPSALFAAGLGDKQIWQYNPGAVGANANGYTTCDDVTPGGCKLEPYKGFWVQLNGTTKGKSVKLLIPKAQ